MSIITEQLQIQNEFHQWLKDNGKAEYKLVDIFVNENNELKLEKQMAWVMHVNPNDWKDFCKVTNRDCNSTKEIIILKGDNK